MKFIHTADIHLGAQPDKGYPWSRERAGELWQTFHNILRDADRERADLLLIAGDLFHRPPSLRELKEVNALFRQLSRTRVVIIAGNHDHVTPDGAICDFTWAENVTFLGAAECEAAVFLDLSTTVYGLSYHRQEILENLYDPLSPDGTKGCHILLAHGGDARHIPFDRAKLAGSGFDYIALGHIHRPGYLAPNMAYAGAPEPIDPGDTGEHGYILGEYRDGEIRTRFVPCACREYIPLELEVTPDAADGTVRGELAGAIARYGPRNIYRVTVTGRRDPDIVLDTASYKSLGNILEAEDLSVPDYDLDRLKREHAGDLLGRFMEKLSPRPGEDARQRDIREKALYYGLGALKH